MQAGHISAITIIPILVLIATLGFLRFQRKIMIVKNVIVDKDEIAEKVDEAFESDLNKDSIKILSWNVFLRINCVCSDKFCDYKNSRMEKIYDFCNVENPDIICFQEMQLLGNVRGNTMAKLMDDGGYIYRVFGDIPPFNPTVQDTSGVCAFSKWPISNFKYYAFNDGLLPDRLAAKGAIIFRISIKKSDEVMNLTIVVSHLQAGVDDTAAFEVRQEQFKQLQTEFIPDWQKEIRSSDGDKGNESDDPIIICLDGNQDRNSEKVNFIQSEDYKFNDELRNSKPNTCRIARDADKNGKLKKGDKIYPVSVGDVVTTNDVKRIDHYENACCLRFDKNTTRDDVSIDYILSKNIPSLLVRSLNSKIRDEVFEECRQLSDHDALLASIDLNPKETAEDLVNTIYFYDL